MTAHTVFRLTQKLYETPLLVNKHTFNSIETYLASRNTGMMVMPQMPMDDMPEKPDSLDEVSGVGVVSICGPLTYKLTGMEMLCGGCSYQDILDTVDDMIDAGIECIVLSIDSGGGEAYGAFETANTLRQKCDDVGVSLVSYIDGSCCSAAYAIACVADEVICNPYGEAGSIGVLVSLIDDSKQMEQEGLKRVFVTAGNEKIPYAEDGSFKKEFITDLQMKVDSLYQAFAEHVSNYTGLSIEDVKNTQAKTYMAKDALQMGLVNKIMTNSEFVDYVVSKQQGSTNA